MSYFTGKIPTPTDGFTLRLDYEIDTDDDGSYIYGLVGRVKRNHSSYVPAWTSKTCIIQIYRLDEDDDWISVKKLSDSGPYNINTDSYVKLIDKSDDEIFIEHKEDGSQKVKIVFTVDGKLSEYYPKGKISKTITLDDIEPEPVYTASTLNSATMSITTAEAITMNVSVTKSYPYYYDKLLVYNQSGTQLFSYNLGTTSGSSTITITDSTTKQAIFNSIGSSYNATLNCKLATYTNSSYTSLKGYSSTLNFTASIPQYTLSLDSVSVTDSEDDYDTYKPTASTFIAYLSKPTLTLFASSSTGYTYGKTISYLIDGVARTSPYIDNNFTGNNYSIVATDNRVSSTATTTSLTIVNYVKPTISCTVTRNTNLPTKANVSVSGTYYGGSGLTNLETAILTLKYTESGSQQVVAQVSFTPTLEDGIYSFNEDFELTGLNAKKVLTWEIVLSDLVGYKATATGNLTKQYPLWHGYTDSSNEQVMKIYGNLEVTEDVTIGNSTLQSYIENVIATKLLERYPVGALYISTNSTNPQSFLGGTWTQITDDAYLKIVSSSAGSLGGTSSDHKIPVESIPSHYHTMKKFKKFEASTGSSGKYAVRDGGTDTTISGTTDETGGGQAYYPYYYGIYVWKRTA